ncbi:MAG: hypothetical protein L0332_01370 [Chloroflexi bacterium]|nr:hypothetical protein [Chloroflexota bacterium]MCI0577410.1 hypothetical protein [Chloroflexota bacterium]MCI0649604.1 hypothetical protein [Chloroflexota bacterium]MCI0725372.1 hypothetical protein [Chloroflexota bacterium]
MAYYLVRAKLKSDLAQELRRRVERKEFLALRPFGQALTRSLEGARWDAERQEAVWEEEDYCSPPLEMERAVVLDHYFDRIRVERVSRNGGWKRIVSLPSLWT